jgi:hypothetical protein
VGTGDVSGLSIATFAPEAIPTFHAPLCVAPTVHGPLCVAATVPEIVVDPVTGTGLALVLTSVTFGPFWAAARFEFIIVPIAASSVKIAAAIRWFLNLLIASFPPPAKNKSRVAAGLSPK